MHPSPWVPTGGAATARVISRMDVDGFFLITDYIQERGGRVSYRAHGVFGWDGSQQRCTMHWFDSLGNPPMEPAFGSWTGDTLTFEQSSPMGRTRYVYRMEGDGRYAMRIEHSPDGADWTPFMEGRYTRN